ncbi:MAG: putative colicin production protein [Pseudomonadota bacterium]|jgi:membrane protein required for colicin V production
MDMAESSVNPVDLAVIAIVAISALMAFARGFVREVLSVAAWIGAAFVTLYLFSFAADYTRQYIDSRTLADAAAALALFITALIVFSIFTHMIAERVQDSSLSAIDRSLGVLFGVARGAVLVSLGYLVAVYIWADAQPRLLIEARARPFMAAGADMIRDLLPSSMSAAEREAHRLRREAEEALRLERMANPQPATRPERPADQQGYDPQQRGQLDQIIRNTTGDDPPPRTGQ